MTRGPPGSTRTDTLVPDPTRFRSPDPDRRKVTRGGGKVVVDEGEDRPDDGAPVMVPAVLAPGDALVVSADAAPVRFKVDVDPPLRWRGGFVEFAEDRKSAVSGKSVSGRVAPDGPRIVQKNTQDSPSTAHPPLQLHPQLIHLDQHSPLSPHYP